ncbi:MAG: trypsin domain/PDZ domain protein [Gemmatimonadetes bacterium]|nr:trypsin domain/PDZ domain protein [Gemmatimonadota bacterium]
MTIELRILSGSRAGARERFDQSVITVGRHPLSDLRFDPLQDLEVSTRHAELRAIDGGWSVHDSESTNGTYVNGVRISGDQRLGSGDVISLGASGPRVEAHLIGTPATTTAAATAAAKPARRDTTMRIAEAVHAETASLKRWFAIAVGAVIVVAATALVVGRRQASTRERELLALIARSESSSVPLRQTIASMQARDSMFARALAERDAASARETAKGRQLMGGGSSAESMTLLSARVATETRVRRAIAQMDFVRVREMNDPAVALIASDLDGTFIAGTAFSVSSSGELVTNRHVIRSEAGNAPRRIRVLFANTTEWLPARLIRVSDDDDLALLQVEGGGTYPVVAGVSRTGSETRVGSPVATIGFPHAVDTPMEGTGINVRARTTTTAGTVSKRLADVLQIDSYAGKGSSGSPVLDVAGRVIGVVYGGEAESNGRIVYAVPAERLAAFLSGASILR